MAAKPSVVSPKSLLAGGALLAVLLGWLVMGQGVHSLDDLKRVFAGEETTTTATETANPPVARAGETIRVGSFNIQVFGESKLAKPHVMRRLADIARRFDILAIQEVRSINQDILPTFVEMINENGARYDYVIGPRIGRTVSKEQYAFVFDTASVAVDRNQIYTVDDPYDRLHREPLCVPFQVRGPAAELAFTFMLVNIHTDPDETDEELDALADVYMAVKAASGGEDDIIILGDLNVDDQHLGRLGQISGIDVVIRNQATNTRGTAQYDNIVFHSRATQEFSGKGGVFDLLREYNLTMEEALEISDHLPVWAELSIYEGGQPGRIAARPDGAAPTR